MACRTFQSLTALKHRPMVLALSFGLSTEFCFVEVVGFCSRNRLCLAVDVCISQGVVSSAAQDLTAVATDAVSLTVRISGKKQQSLFAKHPKPAIMPVMTLVM